jgi:methyl-accepting chemotaxis protein
LALRDMVIVKNKAAVRQEVERVQSASKVIGERFNKLKETTQSNESKAQLNKALEARLAYVGGQDQFLKLVAADRRDEAAALLVGTLAGQKEAYAHAVASLIDHQSELMVRAVKEGQAYVSFGTMLLMALSAVALALATGLAVAMVRGLTRQLGGEPAEAAAVAHQVAQGDLVTPVPVKPGDTTSLMAALANMQKSCRRSSPPFASAPRTWPPPARRSPRATRT